MRAAVAATVVAPRAARAGCRRAHFAARATAGSGRAWIGRPSRNRARSSARAAADGYRRPAFFCRHFRQIVSRSRGTAGCSRAGGTGSSLMHLQDASRAGVSPWNGGRPVSSSYRIAPRA